MVRKCGVEGCLSDSNRPEDVGVTYHKVPMHSDIRPKWVSLCRISEEKKECKVIYVCSRHFLRADFCHFKGRKYMLKQGVLPSVFPWDKSKLEALKAEIKKETETVETVKLEPDVGEASKIEEGTKPLIEPKEEMSGTIEPKEESLDIVECKQESFPEMFLTNVSCTQAATIEPVAKSAETDYGPIDFVIDSQIEALDFNNTWYPARIAEVDYEENEVLIHFDTFAAKYEEWICMDSPRLRPLQETVGVLKEIAGKMPAKENESGKKIPLSVGQYVLGERCLASWSNAKKFSATVTKILENDMYEVLFDDGNVKTLKVHRMQKSEGIHLQSSPLFDPVQGTKQERRDKKRKLDVAALFGKRPKVGSENDDKQESQPSPTNQKQASSQSKDSTPVQAKTSVQAKTPVQTKTPAQTKTPVQGKSNSKAPVKRQSRGRRSDAKVVQKSTVTDVSQAQQIGPPKETTAVPPKTEQSGDIARWLPKWINGRPVGIESIYEAQDGVRKSYIVADPRLPEGWIKHVVQRPHGASAGKWESIIFGPDGKRFRTKGDIRTFLETHPTVGHDESLFDFSLHRRSRKSLEPRKPKVAARKVGTSKTMTPKVATPKTITSKGATPKASTPKVSTPKVATPKMSTDLPSPAVSETDSAALSDVAAPPMEEQLNDKNEGETVSDKDVPNLKILHIDNTYKCPIEGCGKNFRKENLAQMHVKHYHPEYTKFLDSTPNVADLAYARTVGDSLDRSPGPPRTPPAPRATSRATAPKPSTSKVPHSPLVETDIKPLSPQPLQAKPTKDAEIIKLLNSKPVDSVKEVEESQQSNPSPSLSHHMETKLRDLFNKPENIATGDEMPPRLMAKTLPRSTGGIKTLLPVRPPEPDQVQEPPEPPKKIQSSKSSSRHGLKRKKVPEIVEPDREKELKKEPPAEIPEPLQLQPLQEAPPPEPPTHIIEGGKLIKIVRMKQEEIINCTCGYAEEDGLMIQCELCLCWQHAYCNNIEQENQVPEKYVCYICQNPPRQRPSRKYFHDQDWLKQGVLPTASYHSKDEEALQKRFEKLKKAHDISGGLVELKDYVHSLRVKLKIAEAKNHPKLYLWSKPWEKLSLPEKMETEEEMKNEDQPNADQQTIKDETVEKDVLGSGTQQNDPQNDSMLMMILKGGKDDNKLDLIDDSQAQTPLIPQPEAAIDSAVCRINLLDHVSHAQNLVDERLDDFEKKIEALEEGLSVEESEDYPKTRQTLQMLLRDLNTMREFSSLSSI